MKTIHSLKFYPIVLISFLLLGACSDTDKSLNETPQKPFDFVEQMPEFPDGQAAMMKFILENIKYPEMARNSRRQGTVVIQFTVMETGKTANIRVARGIGLGCDEEAVRVVSIMPAWKPGKHNGKAVPVNFTLPIKFELE